MLLLAPSTASELEIGKLDLELLNSWLNEAEKSEKSPKFDENRKTSDLSNYFKYLSEKFEEYNSVLEMAIEEGRFNGVMSRIIGDDEKMGEDWSAMLSKDEKIESQNSESYNENVLDLKDTDQTRTYISSAAYILLIYAMTCPLSVSIQHSTHHFFISPFSNPAKCIISSFLPSTSFVVCLISISLHHTFLPPNQSL